MGLPVWQVIYRRAGARLITMDPGKWDVSNRSIVIMCFWGSLLVSAAITVFGLWWFESGLTQVFVIGFFALFGFLFLCSTFNTIAMKQLYKSFRMDVPDPPPKSGRVDDPAKTPPGT